MLGSSFTWYPSFFEALCLQSTYVIVGFVDLFFLLFFFTMLILISHF